MTCKYGYYAGKGGYKASFYGYLSEDKKNIDIKIHRDDINDFNLEETFLINTAKKVDNDGSYVLISLPIKQKAENND